MFKQLAAAVAGLAADRNKSAAEQNVALDRAALRFYEISRTLQPVRRVNTVVRLRRAERRR